MEYIQTSLIPAKVGLIAKPKDRSQQQKNKRWLLKLLSIFNGTMRNK
ncbi:hypothetical protein K0504_17390 [Neiella marina]|uniref:Uncharacterized protein n=1 Tax=Neiella holothuriorum TaxID=2870530 RepID=A0ABS7EKT1_9GAMM|nr:hypothetical protein [Neiella holothuriorum]MBW8192815.1 hypothetical protein [Neiella holothuriorum]